MSRSPRSTTKKLAASIAVLAGVGAFVSAGAFSAFTSSVTNTSNIGSGKVELTNTPTNLLINLLDLIPGDVVTRCVAVQNTGTVPVDVALTKTTGGSTSLLNGLLASVEEGTVTNGITPGSDCAGFVTSSVYRMGSSAISLLGNYSGGVAPTALTTQNFTGWAANTTKYFKVKIAMPLDILNSLQGLSSTLNLVFTAASQAGSVTR